jgi:hypothetical protein
MPLKRLRRRPAAIPARGFPADNKSESVKTGLSLMLTESEFERRVGRVTDQLRPLRRRKLFLDRPNDLNPTSTSLDTRHQAAIERWRMMSLAERQASE